jgi:hypothetical protein
MVSTYFSVLYIYMFMQTILSQGIVLELIAL